MARITYKNYNILEFSEIANSRVKFCVGVIGYLFVIWRNNYDVSFIPSSFIIAISKWCKFDIIEFLINTNYILLLPSNQKNTRYYTSTGLSKIEKKDANLYKMKDKILMLYEVILFDDEVTKWIDKHLHLLNRQNFNHYEHSYKHIKVDIPQAERVFYDPFILSIADNYGDATVKRYEINEYGYDQNSFAGTHYNIFSNRKELLKYTSLVEPVEIGIQDSIPVLLADQLYKTQGDNDYSAFYYKNRFKKAMFRFSLDYDICLDIFYQQLITAIYGYVNVDEFKLKFPKAAKLLRRIKEGGRGLEEPFIGFTRDIKPVVKKDDRRLSLKANHPALKEGQAYYKIVSLVCQIREVQIMREYWRRLKLCDIKFIPLISSVAIEQKNEDVAYYIMDDILKKHIHNKIKYVVLINNVM
jgi:hypothetical protein